MNLWSISHGPCNPSGIGHLHSLSFIPSWSPGDWACLPHSGAGWYQVRRDQCLLPMIPILIFYLGSGCWSRSTDWDICEIVIGRPEEVRWSQDLASVTWQTTSWGRRPHACGGEETATPSTEDKNQNVLWIPLGQTKGRGRAEFWEKQYGAFIYSTEVVIPRSKQSLEFWPGQIIHVFPFVLNT